MPYYYFSTYWHEAAQARSKHARKCGVLVQPFIDFSSYRYRNGHGRRKANLKRCLPRSSRTRFCVLHRKPKSNKKQAKFRALPLRTQKRKTRRKIKFSTTQTHKHIQMQIQAYLLDIARSSTIQRRPPSLVFFCLRDNYAKSGATGNRLGKDHTHARSPWQRGRTRPTPRPPCERAWVQCPRCHRDHFVAQRRA